MNRGKPVSVAHVISVWLYGSLILISGETTLRLGAFGGAVLSGSFWLSYFLMFLWFWKKREFPIVNPRKRDRMGEKLLALSYRVEIVTFELVLAGMLLHLVLNLPVFQAYVLTLLASLALLLLAFRVQPDFRWNNLVRLVLSLILAFFLPIYTYLQMGLETVYHNLLHYHPRVLHLEQSGLLPFLIAGTCILFANMVAYFMNQPARSVDPPSFLRDLCLTAVIWSAAVMAFSSIAIVAITEKIEPSFLNELSILLMKEISSSPVFFIFSVMLLLISFSSLSAPAFLVGGWRGHSKEVQKLNLFEVLLPFLGGAAGLMTIFYFHWSLLDFFILFGIFQGPLGVWKMGNLFLLGEKGGGMWIPVTGVFVAILAHIFSSASRVEMVIWSTGAALVFLLVTRVLGSFKRVIKV
ncbi:membrane hypothetical protein [[Clostridium] ultunense Esp]|nr:membrane hypothetical protein [[Clostridium] ultunense Esp]